MNPNGDAQKLGHWPRAGRWMPVAMGFSILAGTVALLLLADRHHEVTGAEPLEIIPSALTANLPGKQVTARVQVRNRSKRQVSLGDIRSSCGCTVVEPAATDQLSAGETTEFVVMMSVPRFGTREVTIQFSSDGREYSIPVTLQGERDPVPRLIGFPRDIALRGRSHKTIESRTFSFDAIELAGSAPWVEGIDSADSQIRADVVLADEVPYGRRQDLIRRSYVVTLEGEIDDPRRSVVRAEIVPKVRAMEDEFPLERCLVALEVVPMVTPAPRQLTFLTKRGESRPAVKSVLLAANGPETVTFEVASVDRHWLDAKIVDSASRVMKTLVVSLSAAPEDQLPVESEIVLICSVEGSNLTERVVIPVMIAEGGDSD